MDMTEAVRTLIISKASSSAIKAAAAQTGFKTLRQAGLVKAAAGVTTIEEVLRVTQEAEGI
jgi:general secretion pathway protein E